MEGNKNLVSLFNGISTFVGHLMSKSIVEEGRIRWGSHTYPVIFVRK